MELETTFYIIGIICMSLITLILIGLIAVMIMIKIKINHIHNSIQDKLSPIKNTVKHVENAVKKTKRKLKV